VISLPSTLATVAGAHRDLLERAPRDRVKQASLGGVLLTTAALAAVSCAVALTMAMRLPWPVAVAGGLLWGVGIYNLDRWLVVSTPRGAPLRTALVSLVRIGLAVVIGAVVSTPLTLVVFDAEISAELQRMHTEDEARFEEELATDPVSSPWRVA
jgi:ABC-type nitrate/sulfonate/bicarbonate transport system permease component